MQSCLSEEPAYFKARKQVLLLIRQATPPLHIGGHPAPGQEPNSPNANVWLGRQRKTVGGPHKDSATFLRNSPTLVDHGRGVGNVFEQRNVSYRIKVALGKRQVVGAAADQVDGE